MGKATLTNTSVYANQAGYVCSPFELSLNFHPAPRWNVTCAHDWQFGGGLYIAGTATLTNTNVYANQVDTVCLPLKCPCTFIQRPAGTLRVLMVGSLAEDSTSRARQR